MTDFISVNIFADIMGVSRATVEKWIKNGTLTASTKDGVKGFHAEDLVGIPIIDSMMHTKWDQEMQTKPAREYTSIELFAGGGGLALGMEMAGFHHIMLNEFDHNACETLRVNRPNWNVIEGDVHDLDFTQYRGKVDFISGGFPCTAFSYAGERRGFEDARGTLFFELARAVKEIQPKVFMGENVKGLVTHDNGRTLQVIKDVIKDIGYTLVEPEVLKAILYQVPQKRERLILVAIRNDLAGMVNFRYPEPYERVLTLRDALYKGILYNCDVPASEGQKYPQRKKEIMEMVPEGGNWRDLPEDIQREYLKGSVRLDGGKTGIARRLSMDEPSLTLTCAPAMKQTERCHPYETRPLTVREYARIQTFPDDWKFMGKLDSQYKQIGNAVPVNLAYAIGRSLIRLFNDIDKIENKY
jgi:DNA (cytosine-5)-methyltransferase 1